MALLCGISAVGKRKSPDLRTIGALIVELADITLTDFSSFTEVIKAVFH